MQPADYKALVAKYNKPVPRYTSYPTVPFWKDDCPVSDWHYALLSAFTTGNNNTGISLYIHLPFCESLCTYCGCNKKITTNHSVEDIYLDALEKEWTMYISLFPEKPVIRELHLGGGTPTFFAPANLQRMMRFLLASSLLHKDFEFSIEGHPNNTTLEHLQVLYNEGFRRISYGVQDFDDEVQRVINRIQPVENVRSATEAARSIGFSSVNFDLVYGLPKQHLKGLQQTIKQVIDLRPDRIAFYSYAHVPWTSRGQRLYDERDLPSPETKLQLYLEGRKMLTAAGYVDIGMDHYALPGDSLHTAWQDGTLHRNFMGYTTQQTGLLLGLGVSSISDAGTAFAQNHKTLGSYYEAIEKREWPMAKGFVLSEEDRRYRHHILDICCKGRTAIETTSNGQLDAATVVALENLQEDGLVMLEGDSVMVTDTGRNFLRNIAASFDLYLQRASNNSVQHRFSQAV